MSVKLPRMGLVDDQAAAVNLLRNGGFLCAAYEDQDGNVRVAFKDGVALSLHNQDLGGYAVLAQWAGGCPILRVSLLTNEQIASRLGVNIENFLQAQAG